MALQNRALLLRAIDAAAPPTCTLLRRLDLRAIEDTDWQRAIKPLMADTVYCIARTLAGGCCDDSALNAIRTSCRTTQASFRAVGAA
jgi:hypothetical protein